MRDACRRSSESLDSLLALCAESAWKNGEGVLMSRFRLSMRGLSCRLGTVLNILFVCVPLGSVCNSEGRKGARGG